MSLRNVAIIAHVDHGKTTLVDQLLAQSGAVRANEAHAERAMDSNDQERERGITILAKCTSVLWHGEAGDTRINIIDTPGHADFGGEVERILGMVDGCLLLVDAEEGVMPQTKFVLGKALKMGLRPILCLNKVDRPHADPDRVLNDVFDLFAALGATDEQLDFPHLYASGKQGWAVKDLSDPHENLAPLYDLIVRHVPRPSAEARANDPACVLAVLIESDPFLGRLVHALFGRRGGHVLDDLVEDRGQALLRIAHVDHGPALLAGGVEVREVELVVVRAHGGEQVEGVVQHAVRVGVRPVDLVQHHDGMQADLQRLAEHELGLRHNAFLGVDQQHTTIDHAQDTLDLTAEVGVAGGVDDVDAGLARLAVPEHRGALGQDGDAALALLIVGVHGAFGVRLIGAERTRLGEQLIDQGGLAVVDVGDDGDVAKGHGG